MMKNPLNSTPKPAKLAISAMIVANILAICSPANAATTDITGQWQLKQNGETATVAIHPKGGAYVGTIVQGKKYVGKDIITGLKASGQGKYTGGTIIDPTNGKHYSLNAEVKGNVLSLRGYVGTPMLGSTQIWVRK